MNYSVISSDSDGAATIGRFATRAEAVRVANEAVAKYSAQPPAPWGETKVTVFGPGERRVFEAWTSRT